MSKTINSRWLDVKDVKHLDDGGALVQLSNKDFITLNEEELNTYQSKRLEFEGVVYACIAYKSVIANINYVDEFLGFEIVEVREGE